MNEERLLKVIISPVVSEKSMRAADKNRQFVFKIRSDANKPTVKSAVEYLFSVKVDSVQITNVKGKRRNFRNIAGERSGWKKAYVKLAVGHDIDFSRFGSKE